MASVYVLWYNKSNKNKGEGKLRKLITFLTVICLAILITACINENTKSGQVVAYGGNPIFFEVACEDAPGKL